MNVRMSKRKNGAENGVETATNGTNSKRPRTNEHSASSHELSHELPTGGYRENTTAVARNSHSLKKAKREAKLERRRMKRNSKAASVIPKTDAKSQSKHKRNEKNIISTSSSWNVSSSIGGHLIQLDPVFSSDEQSVE